jgi:protein SCO1/2
LAEYINYFDPSFLAATGSDDELKGLTQPLGIMYAKVTTEKSAMGYVMDHSASIILVDPEGRYHALFSPPHDARIMADDFIKISENY